MPRDRDTRLKVPTLCFGAGAVGLGALIYHLSRVEYRDAKRRIEQAPCMSTTEVRKLLQESPGTVRALVQGSVACTSPLLSPDSGTKCCYMEYRTVLFHQYTWTSREHANIRIADNAGEALVLLGPDSHLPSVKVTAPAYRRLLCVFGYCTEERVLRPETPMFVAGNFRLRAGRLVVSATMGDEDAFIMGFNTPEYHLLTAKSMGLLGKVVGLAGIGIGAAVFTHGLFM